MSCDAYTNWHWLGTTSKPAIWTKKLPRMQCHAKSCNARTRSRLVFRSLLLLVPSISCIYLTASQGQILCCKTDRLANHALPATIWGAHTLVSSLCFCLRDTQAKLQSFSPNMKAGKDKYQCMQCSQSETTGIAGSCFATLRLRARMLKPALQLSQMAGESIHWNRIEMYTYERKALVYFWSQGPSRGHVATLFAIINNSLQIQPWILDGFDFDLCRLSVNETKSSNVCWARYKEEVLTPPICLGLAIIKAKLSTRLT